MQVYDHNARIPLLVHVPSNLTSTIDALPTFPASMVDIAPTVLQLAGANASDVVTMDGISFFSQLHDKSTWDAFARDSVLIEYQSLQGGPHIMQQCSEFADAYGLENACTDNCIKPTTRHVADSPNNSYSALRVMNDGSVGGGYLYAEFIDVSNPDAWDFEPDTINFYELYNMTDDPYALHNMCVCSKSLNIALLIFSYLL